MSRPVSADLHELIHALTQTEKRYVRLFLTRHVDERENKSVRLYDAIAAQTSYDEALLKRTASGESFVKRLPEAKRELTRMILRAMRQYHAENGRQRRAITALLDADFLHERGLDHLALEHIDDAMRLAVETEDYALATRAILHRDNYTYRSDPHPSDLPPLDRDPVIQSAEALLEFTTFYQVAKRMAAIVQRYGHSPNAEARRLAEHLVQEALSRGKPVRRDARMVWLRILSRKAFWIDHDYTAALEYDLERLKIFESDPHYRIERMGPWINLQFTVASQMILTKRPNEALPFLESFRSILAQERLTADIRRGLKEHIVNIETLYYLNTLCADRYQVTGEEVRNLIADLDRYGPSQAWMGARLNLGLYRAVVGQLTDALTLISPVADSSSPIRADIRTACRLLRIIIHYDLGHTDLVESLVRSERRRKRASPMPRDEEYALSVLARLADTTSATRRRKLLDEALQTIDQLLLNPETSTVITVFNFASWLRARRTAQPWSTTLLQ
ncbi:MAG: hypothetical protein MUC47_06935 [Candidatus Kapabacteria bacterium]|nr:hypothetical protein [Candidatus Kapabacteria bacterium]